MHRSGEGAGGMDRAVGCGGKCRHVWRWQRVEVSAEEC